MAKNSSPGSSRRKMIALVEDNIPCQMLIREIFGDMEIMVFSSGEEALGAFETALDSFALVLIDLRLPHCDGGELLQKIRGMGYNGPAIAISALSPATLKSMSESAGFDAWASKPFEMDEFVRLVGSYLF